MKTTGKEKKNTMSNVMFYNILTVSDKQGTNTINFQSIHIILVSLNICKMPPNIIFNEYI